MQLLIAAQYGYAAVVRLLLEKCVNLETKDNSSRTPLSWAAGNGHNAVVGLLLATDSINPDPKDSMGRTPLSWATENGHEAEVGLLLATRLVDPNSRDKSSRSPLWYAYIIRRRKGLVKLLRLHNASL
jgi:ankyrin repeat protein